MGIYLLEHSSWRNNEHRTRAWPWNKPVSRIRLVEHNRTDERNRLYGLPKTLEKRY
jgi:hypothetical protein